MKDPDLSQWTPRPTSLGLRSRIYGPASRTPSRPVINIASRVTFVVTSVWLFALAVAWSPAPANPVPQPPSWVNASVVVAQNSLPACGFTFTNSSHPLYTNRTQGSL